MRDRHLALNTALLTVSGLIIRLVGTAWQIWLVGRIGEAGTGLFQLILSVGGLAATVAVSGSRYTATRMYSEQAGQENLAGAATAMGACMCYGTFFGLASGLILMLIAEPVGFLWLGDARTVQPVMLLALEMPLIGIDSVTHGYFTAVGRVWKSVVTAVAQQLVTIALTACFLSGCPDGNIETSCLAVTGGRVLGSLFEVICMTALYISDRRRHNIRRGNNPPSVSRITNRMLSVALPVAAASYARSGLSTLQHLLVPSGLRRFGLDAEAALAGYGVIQGMALPVVLFPSCVMLAAAELIVPYLTELQMRGNGGAIRDITEDIFKKGLMFSALTTSMLLALGESLGSVLFSSPDAGKYIQLFALIVPVMYMDMLADGCLKGLGEMMFCMAVNIADAGLSALLVWFALPRWGLVAYIFVICFTETFNFAVSCLRLHRKAGTSVSPRFLIRVSGWAMISGAAAWRLNHAISAGNGVPALIISGLCGIALYGFGITSGAGAGRRASA